MDIFGFDDDPQDRGILGALGLTRSDTGFTMYVTPSTAELRIKDNHREKDEIDPALSTSRPGKTEAAVIICLVVIVLLAAAKYIGCNLCPCLKKKRSHRSHDQTYRPVRRENILQRPEYDGGLAYATYSRPTSGIATVDARGYGYDHYDDGEAKVYTGGDIIDPPPQYNSLVPPTYNTSYNYYTYSDTKSGRNVGDVVL